MHNIIQLENQNIISIQPTYIPPIIPAEPNAIPGVPSTPAVEREILSNIKNKDNIEINDRQEELIKIIKEKEEKESKIKEEKKENAKYRLIQLKRDKQQRIASLFNKLDKKISQIKRTVIEAWNMKAKVMSIKTILKPLKYKPKKKKKKVKKEEDNNQDIFKDKN